MRHRSMLAVALASLVSLSGVAEAQYRWVDAQGRVHYSNMRPAAPAPPEALEPAKVPAESPALPPEPGKRYADPRALIEEVLDLSGAKKQIAQIPAAVQAQLSERRAEMRPADYERASQVIAESYRSEALYQAVVETYNRRFDEQRLMAVAQALRSPLFRRITELEVQASRPEAMVPIRAYAARLRQDGPPVPRLALLRRLDDVAGVTETNVDVMVATIRAIATALEPILPPGRRLNPAQLEQKLGAVRSQTRPYVRNDVLVNMLYTYRSLTDEELRQYLAFYESETGRWYTRVSHEGALSAMSAAAEEAGRRIGRGVSAGRAPQPAAGAQPVSSASTVTQQNWALAASAILTERNGQRHDLLAGTDLTDANVKKYKQVLNEWWGVTSRADLFMVLKWLDEGGDRQEFERLAEFSHSLSPAQHQELRRRLQRSDNQAGLVQLAMVDRYSEKLGKKSLLGWDYARYISLCRWGYLVGYLSEEEAWGRILPAARALRSTFDSWKDLGENYLLGREFWSFERSQKDGQLYRSAYQKLLSDPGSPWNRYAWEMSLDTTPLKAAKASRPR